MAANELASIQEVKEYLKITDPEDKYNHILGNIMKTCQGTILSRLSRDIFKTTYTSEYYNIDYPNIHVLKLKQYPIISVTSVIEDEIALIEDETYKVNYGGRELYRISFSEDAYWDDGKKVIAVTYTAGYAKNDIPSCLIGGFLDYCYWKFYYRDGGAIEEITTGGTGAVGTRIVRGKLINGIPENVWYAIMPEMRFD